MSNITKNSATKSSVMLKELDKMVSAAQSTADDKGGLAVRAIAW